jgi:acetyl-CoA acetyltransferase
MIYDAFAHLPIYGLEDLGFCQKGEAAGFIWERNTAPGGKLPLNTNGGGLSYMHSGMYGMYALQESVRQLDRLSRKILGALGRGEDQRAAAVGRVIQSRSALRKDSTMAFSIIRATGWR